MKKRPLAVLAVIVTLPFVRAAEKKLPTQIPDSFILGRHTSIDIGPPFDFYEILSVHSDRTGTVIRRITVTPPGNRCPRQPATVEDQRVSWSMPISELLGGKNPCSIAEKDLNKELSRCKKCLVFTRADITMSIRCGDQNRVIRMDILDRDMFDPAPNTPEHTSWTMALLARLDQALGGGVLDRPIFTLDGKRDQTPVSPELDNLRRGVFDTLFMHTPDKPSELYIEAQNPPPQPTVLLAKISPVRPVSEALPPYPTLARAANISGVVSFTLSVAPDGTVADFQVVDGHPLLRKAVETELLKWRFQPEAVGRSVEGSVEFSTNCSR